MIHVVGIGGGTGLSVLLRGLRDRSRAGGVELAASAVVCVSGDGGWSGLLRQAFGIPDGLAGHALSNPMLTALDPRSESLQAAVQSAADLLLLKANVFQVTAESVRLCALLADGSVARAEAEIAAARQRIQRIWLEPDRARATAETLETITSADAIVLGPGSLYTSILSSLLVPGVTRAIRRSRAVKIFPCNLMTEPGKTQGFTAADHVRVIEEYLDSSSLDFCLMNSSRMGPALERALQEDGSSPVLPDPAAVARLGVIPLCTDLLSANGSEARHDPGKLARLVLSLTRERSATEGTGSRTRGEKRGG